MLKIDEEKFERKKLLFLVMCASLFLIIAAFIRYPDVRNEMKYFIIIDEMIKNKEVWILTYLGELYPDKPPIYFWILYVIKRNFPTMFYSMALLFGTVIPCIIIGFLTNKIYKNMFIVALLMSVPFYLGNAVFMRMDILMAVFTTISIMFFYKGYTEKNNKYNFYIYLGMALAVLVKGGGGVITPFATILLFLYINEDRKYLKKINLGYGMLFVISVLISWFAILWIRPNGSEYVNLLVGKQTIGRAINASGYGHPRPIYFYLERLPLTFMPYGFILITTVFSYIKDFKNRKNWTLIEKLSFSWFIGPLIIFSLVKGKLDIYLVPVYPAIAGLIYCYFERRKWKKSLKINLYIIFAILTIILLGGGIAALIFSKKYGSLVQGILFLAALLPMYGAYRELKDDNFKSAMVGMIGVIIFFFGILTYSIPQYNERFTLKPFEAILRNLEDRKEIRDNIIALYKFKDGNNLARMVNLDYLITENKKDIDALLLKEGELVVIGRDKYVNDIKNSNYDYEIIFENEANYIAKIKFKK